MGKDSDPPPAPDYGAIANEQGELNERALAQQLYANRPTQVTPWSTTSWTPQWDYDPGTGERVTRWTQTQTLDPDLQASLSAQLRMGAQRAGAAEGMMDRAVGSYADPLEFDQFREVGDIEDPMAYRDRAEEAVYDRLTSRLDPAKAEEQQSLEVALRNRGLRPGDEAYEAEVDRFNRNWTDRYQTAMNEAVGAGREESRQLYGQQQAQQAQNQMLRQAEIAEALQQRNLPLAEIGNLLAGQGVQPPSAPGFMSAGMATPANVVQAAQNQYAANVDAYNAGQARQQGIMSGLGSLANAGIAAYGAGMFSDRRLKHSIVQIGWWLGRPLYHFFYLSGYPGVGVMSDEVNQDAVYTHESGYDVVDYSAVTPA